MGKEPFLYPLEGDAIRDISSAPKLESQLGTTRNYAAGGAGAVNCQASIAGIKTAEPTVNKDICSPQSYSI